MLFTHQSVYQDFHSDSSLRPDMLIPFRIIIITRIKRLTRVYDAFHRGLNWTFDQVCCRSHLQSLGKLKTALIVEIQHGSGVLADIEEVNIGDSGELLFDVDFDSLVRSEIVPQEMKDELPKPE